MKLLHRNRRSKRGSSLPMVMAIGAALVVWVMALMPLMATSGTTAAQTKALEANYLSSKSSIEFVKGELTEMVEKEGIPSTFVVIGEVTDGVTIYRSIKQTVGGDGGYGTYVLNNVDDNLDAPQADQYGNQVTAICAVVYNTSTGAYDITITTYNKGEKGMVYTATYTVPGSLKIVPEAYRQTQALPLNDFVIVDGKKGALKDGVVGSNIIWNSSLTSGDGTLNYKTYFESGNYVSSFREILLRKPRSSDVTVGYADVGTYPGVLKTTAEAAPKDPTDTDMESRPEEGVPMEREYNSEKWILPTAEDFEWDDKAGVVTVAPDGQLVKTAEDGSRITFDISGKYTLCYNGVAMDSPPKESSSYRVTLNLKGTGTEYDENSLFNVLPVSNLYIGTYEKEANRVPKFSCEIASYKFTGSKLNVKLNPAKDEKGNAITGVYYGYCDHVATKYDDIEWEKNQPNEREFSIPTNVSKTHYFYCYRYGSVNDGVITEASDVVFVGSVTPFVTVSALNEEAEYIIYGPEDGNKKNDMRRDTKSGDLDTDSFEIKEGTLLSPNYTFDTWKVKKVSDDKNDKRWQIYKEIATGNGNEVKYYYLTISQASAVRNDGTTGYGATPPYYTYSYSVALKEGPENNNDANTYFNVEGDSSSLNTVKIYQPQKEYTGEAVKGITGYVYYWTDEWKDISKPVYLSIESDGVYVADTSTDEKVYFAIKPDSVDDAKGIQAPSPELLNLNVAFDYGFTKKSLVEALKANGFDPEKDVLYINGERQGTSNLSDTALPVGYYRLYGSIYDEGKADRWVGIPLGLLTIEPEEFELKSSLTVDLSVGYEAALQFSDWYDKGGTKYYGYYPIGELEGGQTVADIANNLTTADFFWTMNSTIEELQPGHYLFAVAQGNTNNSINTGGIAIIVIPEADADGKPFPGYRVTYPYLYADAFPESNNSGDVFKFEIDEGTGEVTWWGLPNALNDAPSRVTLYHRVVGTTDWKLLTGALDPAKEYEFAITVVDSDYEIEYFLLPEDTKPAEFDSYGEHVTSVLSGSSLYFMGGSDAGGGYSIDTHGNKIILTTDLLVIKDGIKLITEEDTGKIMGKVVVYPYTENHSYTLMFTVKGFGPFAPKTFYLVPAGFNIARATEAHVSSWTSYPVTNGEIPHVIKGYFNSKFYPTMNADIAYTTNEQLAHIVSGEAIGWTENGVLSGSDVTTGWSSAFSTFKDDAKNNMKYVVCAYVDSISGQVTRMANRVMIAAAEEQDFNLNVTNNLAIWSRYLSLDAKVINRGGSSQFIVNNLADKTSSNIIDWLKSWLGDVRYDSDTIQVDFECFMKINGRDQIAQVCRYNHGDDLFTDAASEYELMVEYNTNAVDEALWAYNVNSTVIMQDRYVSFTNTGSDTTISIDGGVLNRARYLKVHSNYILFDGITEVSLPRKWDGQSSFTINTQESGYTNGNDYMWLFTQYSAENYHGVMLRFNQATTIKQSGKTDITIPEGFYFVPSPGGQLNAGDPTLGSSGMSIYTFAEYVKNGKFKITDEEMREFAPYINLQTGEITGAYVDTGLEGGVGGGGNTGFTGGGVK